MMNNQSALSDNDVDYNSFNLKWLVKIVYILFIKNCKLIGRRRFKNEDVQSYRRFRCRGNVSERSLQSHNYLVLV